MPKSRTSNQMIPQNKKNLSIVKESIVIANPKEKKSFKYNHIKLL